MKRFVTVAWLVSAVAVLSSGQQSKKLYENTFQSASVDKLPDDLLVLDGGFLVKEEQGNRFLELPGFPLESYSVLFGPTEKEGVSASARFYGTARGRRFPAFSIGLNGAGGYRLQVSPSKRALELYRGDPLTQVLKETAPFAWQSGKWTWLRIQVEKTGATWKISGKAWLDGTAEPKEWSLVTSDSDELPPGRASVGGSPFADTPIRFDDLSVSRIGEK